MYTLVRRYIKTGIGFLAAGVALGVYVPAHVHAVGVAKGERF